MNEYAKAIERLDKTRLHAYFLGRRDIYLEVMNASSPLRALKFDCLLKWNQLLLRAFTSYNLVEPAFAAPQHVLRGFEALNAIGCSPEARKRFNDAFVSYCRSQKDSLHRIEKKRLRMEESDLYIKAPHREGEQYNDRAHRLVMENDETYRALFNELTGDQVQIHYEKNLLPIVDSESSISDSPAR